MIFTFIRYSDLQIYNLNRNEDDNEELTIPSYAKISDLPLTHNPIRHLNPLDRDKKQLPCL